jgi:uncharacterized protein
MTPLRVVLDANVIISALIRPDSARGRILRAAVTGPHLVLLTAAPLIKELQAALHYPRLRRYLKMSASDKEAFVILLEQIGDLVNIADYPAAGLCRDPDDEPYLQTAMAGRADYIVSGDGDLLDMKAIEDIPIVTPAQFEPILRDRVHTTPRRRRVE